MAIPKLPTKGRLTKYMIPASKAVGMCLNYLGDQYKKFSAPKPTMETQCIWYPIDVIEDYIAYVKKISLDSKPVDGIRFYFASYPDAPSGRKENAKKRIYYSRQTMFAMPTVSNGSSYEGDHTNHDSIYIDSSGRKKQVKICDPLRGNPVPTNQNSTLNIGHSYPPPPEN